MAAAAARSSRHADARNLTLDGAGIPRERGGLSGPRQPVSADGAHFQPVSAGRGRDRGSADVSGTHDVHAQSERSAVHLGADHPSVHYSGRHDVQGVHPSGGGFRRDPHHFRHPAGGGHQFRCADRHEQPAQGGGIPGGSVGDSVPGKSGLSVYRGSQRLQEDQRYLRTYRRGRSAHPLQRRAETHRRADQRLCGPVRRR